jgi:hypothetical protein
MAAPIGQATGEILVCSGANPPGAWQVVLGAPGRARKEGVPDPEFQSTEGTE